MLSPFGININTWRKRLGVNAAFFMGDECLSIQARGALQGHVTRQFVTLVLHCR